MRETITTKEARHILVPFILRPQTDLDVYERTILTNARDIKTSIKYGHLTACLEYLEYGFYIKKSQRSQIYTVLLNANDMFDYDSINNVVTLFKIQFKADINGTFYDENISTTV